MAEEGDAVVAAAAAAAAPAAVFTFTNFFRIMLPKLFAFSLLLDVEPTAADTDAATVDDSEDRGDGELDLGGAAKGGLVGMAAAATSAVGVVEDAGVVGPVLLADRRLSSSMRSLREGRKA